MPATVTFYFSSGAAQQRAYEVLTQRGQAKVDELKAFAA